MSLRAITAGVPIDKYSNIAVMAKEAKIDETPCLRETPESRRPGKQGFYTKSSTYLYEDSAFLLCN